MKLICAISFDANIIDAAPRLVVIHSMPEATPGRISLWLRNSGRAKKNHEQTGRWRNAAPKQMIRFFG